MSGESDIELELRKVHCNQCIVGELVTYPFSLREPARKTEIVARGRLQPELTNIFGPKVAMHIRRTMSSWYSQYPWLTCCEHIKKLFCWICLLFREGQRGAGVWSLKGFSDVVRFPTCAKRHESSKSHMDSIVGMRTFRSMRQGAEPDQSTQFASTGEETRCPSDLDETDRILFKRMIDINCIEILRREKEKNKIKMPAKVQNINGTENSILFQSEEVNGRIVNSLYELISDKIKKDIAESPFFSIVVNTISDVSHKTYYAIVYRYLGTEGKVLERVFKVKGGSKDKPDNLLPRLYDWVVEMESGGELISLSFDGGVQASQQSNTLKLIKMKYEHVLLVNCYNHRLNLIMQQAVEGIPSCRSFFQTIAKLSLFFSQSNRRKRAYFTVMGRSKSEPSSLFTAQFLQKIHTNFESLKSLLETMFKYKDDWDGVTNVEARGFYETFNDFDFRFLLSIFSHILPVAENLHGVINKYVFVDHRNCSDSIAKFISDLMECVDGFDLIWNDVNKQDESEEPPRKKSRADQNSRDSYKQLYLNILETISRQCIHRFSNFSSLQFLPLLDTRRFTGFSYKFPEVEFLCLKNEFSKFFDLDRLKQQLNDIYLSKDYRKLDLAQLYKYMIESGRSQAFDQVIRLAAFSLVFPLSKVEGTSALANINSYLVNSGRKMTRKSIIAMEKDVLKQLWTDPTFYDSLMALSARPNNTTE